MPTAGRSNDPPLLKQPPPPQLARSVNATRGRISSPIHTRPLMPGAPPFGGVCPLNVPLRKYVSERPGGIAQLLAKKVKSPESEGGHRPWPRRNRIVEFGGRVIQYGIDIYPNRTRKSRGIALLCASVNWNLRPPISANQVPWGKWSYASTGTYCSSR